MLLVSHGIIKRLISMKTGISLVLESDIGAAADLDGPIQALLENAVAQPVHLGEIVDEFPEFSHPAKGPSGPAKNALHAGVGHSDDFDQFNGKAEFNHTRKQLVTGSSKSAARLRRIRGNIERESAAPPDPIASWRRLAVQQDREDVPQHGWTGRRQKPDATLNTSGSRAVQ